MIWKAAILIALALAMPVLAQIFPSQVKDKATSDNLYYLYEQQQGMLRGNPASGGALCLNASGRVSRCTSAVSAGGSCTCP